jgi:hypothetical protein
MNQGTQGYRLKKNRVLGVIKYEAILRLFLVREISC